MHGMNVFAICLVLTSIAEMGDCEIQSLNLGKIVPGNFFLPKHKSPEFYGFICQVSVCAQTYEFT